MFTILFFNLDLNDYETRKPAMRVAIEGNTANNEDLTVKLVEDYRDHPLIVGPRYQPKDFSLFFSNTIGYYASGVMPVGINGYGCSLGKSC
jgi:putative uncharacterized protein (fragment)